ncbi:MAG: O-antigen ligase family protein [Candidatus Omnitrophica bacterium]|nr:O-antigen ligase family protein [Candidatus Omnitrophota bacterium]
MVLVTSCIIILKNPKAAPVDAVPLLSWILLFIVYLIRNITGNIRGILFSISIFWHIYIFKKIFNTKESLNYAREGINWACICLVAISLIVTIFSPSFRTYTQKSEFIIMRAGGLVYNAQQLSPYIVMSFIFILHKLFCNKKKKKYILLILVILTMAFLTGSRTALSSIIFSAFIFMLLFNNKTRNYMLLLSSIFIINIILELMQIGVLDEDLFNPVYKFYEKYFLREDPKDLYTFGYRLYMWEYGFSKFLESPLLGHGTHNIGEFVSPVKFGSIQEEFMAHNGFIKVLTETGLLGFIPLLIIIISAIFKAIKKIKKSSNELKLPFIFLIIGIYCNLWESWILSFGYAPCWILWLSVIEILIKNNRAIKNV